METLTLDQLRVLDAIASEGTFAGAARVRDLFDQARKAAAG